MKDLTTTRKKELLYIVYILLGFGPLALIALMLGVELPLFKSWGLILFVQQVGALLYFFPLSLYFIATFSLLSFLILQEIRPEWIRQFLEAYSYFQINFNNYIAGYDLLNHFNSILAFIAFGIIFSILCLWLVYKFKRDQFIALGILSYMIYAWYNYYDSAYAYIILYVSVYLSLYTIKKFNRIASSDDIIKIRGIDRQYNEWIRLSHRYILSILVIAFLLPKGGSLIEWQWLENELTRVFPSLMDLRQELEYTRNFTSAELFDFGQTGFVNDDGLLGGPVLLNEKTAFTIQSPYSLYLRGNIMTQFDGKGWQHGKRIIIEEETGIDLQPELLTGEYVTTVVTNENLSSFTLFTPYQTTEVTIERDGKLWIDVNQQITLLGARYKGESYTLRSFIPSTEQNTIITPASILFNKEDYLTLPPLLTDRVRDLALQLTSSASSSREKAAILTDYLRSNYNYTLTPEPLPLGEDIVDHFLFESKEGYCTYFATALSVLLRSIDIPTRYVEGFRMPTEHSNNIYEVKFSNGHAWVEAYFEDTGWITLEATPAFTPPMAPQNIETLTIASEIDLYGIEDEAAYLLALKQDRSAINTDQNTLLETQEENSTWTLTVKALLDPLPSILVLILLIALPLRIIILNTRYKNYYKTLNDVSSKGAFIYGNILELYEHIGLDRMTGETSKAFSKRNKRQLYDFDHDLELITLIYLESKYSASEISKADYNSLLEFYQFAELRVRYKIGHLKYFEKKYIRGKLITLYHE